MRANALSHKETKNAREDERCGEEAPSQDRIVIQSFRAFVQLSGVCTNYWWRNLPRRTDRPSVSECCHQLRSQKLAITYGNKRPLWGPFYCLSAAIMLLLFIDSCAVFMNNCPTPAPTGFYILNQHLILDSLKIVKIWQKESGKCGQNKGFFTQSSEKLGQQEDSHGLTRGVWGHMSYEETPRCGGTAVEWLGTGCTSPLFLDGSPFSNFVLVFRICVFWHLHIWA